MNVYKRLPLLALCLGLVAGCDDDGSATDSGVPMTDGAVPDGGPPGETCSDGEQNQDETDVDCGGVCGASCTPGEMCGDDGDCTTDTCEDGTCAPMATCEDGTQNGTETDVDCGGAMCMPCALGESCTADDDCDSEFCDSMVCTETICGDGIVEGPEDCDAMEETETCDADCTDAVCGDSTLNASAGETCDEGGEAATCDADCTAPVCGDGVVNMAAGEECDAGSESGPAESATCDLDCTTAMCGDGTVNTEAGEQCDDGNMDDTDLCTNACTVNAPSLAIGTNATFDTDTGELDGAVAAGWVAASSTLFVDDFDLPDPVVLTVTGANRFLLVAGGDVTIGGTIDVSGEDGEDSGICSSTAGLGGAGGPGGLSGGGGGLGGSPSTRLDGEPGMGRGGGDAGAMTRSGGGGGGHAAPGERGEGPNGGTGGVSYNGARLVFGGSGGGGGSAFDDGGSGDDGGAGGGGGGGFFRLRSAGSVTITGGVDASGGDGGETRCVDDSGSGGGGSGGTIILEAATLDISAATLDVAGGLGGSAAPRGGDGAEGLLLFEGGCSDGVRNQDETDVDCGGASCAPCAAGGACTLDTDCATGACLSGACGPASCRNGATDGMETDVDCGGTECEPCADGLMCAADSDCAGTGCGAANTCISCSDGIQNGDETDVDCGRSCGLCLSGAMCMADTDCAFGLCEATNLCGSVTTFDFEGASSVPLQFTFVGDADWTVTTAGAINGLQSARAGDIGDSQSSGLEMQVTCSGAGSVDFAYATDSESGFDELSFLIDGTAAPGTSTWSGVDSGTASFTLSAGMHTLRWNYVKDTSVSSGADTAWIDDVDLMGCTVTTPLTMVPQCRNGRLDGSETDVDCGGPTCSPCVTGLMCLATADCAVGECDATAGICRVCGNGIVEGSETCDDSGVSASCDVDCTAVACGDGLINSAAGENCDDGNTVAGDGCDATCRLEPSMIAASGSSISLAGSIDTTDPQWGRAFACSSLSTPADHYYDAFAVTNTTGVAQTLTVTAMWGGDGYLHAYGDPLDLGSVAGCIDSNDDYMGTSQSQMVGVPIGAGSTIYIIASAFSGAAAIGPYTIDVATD